MASPSRPLYNPVLAFQKSSRMQTVVLTFTWDIAGQKLNCAPWWHSELKIWHSHICGEGSIPARNFHEKTKKLNFYTGRPPLPALRLQPQLHLLCLLASQIPPAFTLLRYLIRGLMSVRNLMELPGSHVHGLIRSQDYRMSELEGTSV